MKRMSSSPVHLRQKPFDDVLRLSKDVTDFVKATKQEPMQSPLPQQGQGEEGEDEEQDSPETSPEGSQAPQEDGQQEPVKNGSIPEDKQSSPGGGGSQQQDNELESKTQDSFDEQLESLTNKYRSEDTYYVELPTFDLDKLIITNEYIHDHCDKWYEMPKKIVLGLVKVLRLPCVSMLPSRNLLRRKSTTW